jgi:transcriptional regulator with PAS, ATPase and Fis domain
VQKPWVNEKLVATVNAGVMLRKSRLEVDTLKVKQKALHEIIDEPFHDFIGNSAEMKKVFANIAKVAATDASVLILGENGTGKELVARALHRSSLRRDENFVSIDLGALTESLFESELFGHERGAFTDAKSQRVGRFELAHKGSIFLDEIGNLSFAQQAKLLTVLERREVTKVGANKAASIDIRLICATNMPLVEMVAEEKFREDLLYRINTVEIHLPALRDRGEDAILLAKHFLKIYTKKYAKTVKDLSASAQKLLLSYHWPGNVRELQHAIERAIIMTDSTMLQPEDFIFSQKTKRTDEVALESYNLDEVEKSIIQKVMKKYAGNVSQAAKELGLTRTSLYRRMEKHGL